MATVLDRPMQRPHAGRGASATDPGRRSDSPRASHRGSPVAWHSGHIPGLDGLRALAIVAVLVYHLRPSALPGGFLGVDVFFVLSGFLITTLLLREIRARGRIHLPRFWLRRARRLLPALLGVVVLAVPLAALAGGDLLVGIRRQVAGALTFTTNWVEIGAGSSYFTRTSPQLFVNFWSLAIEEQFYLVWPLVLVMLLAFTRTARQRIGVAAAIALTSAVAMAVLVTPGEDATRVYYGTDTHLFGLMLGVALAFAWSHGLLKGRLWRRWRTLAGWAALAALAWLMTALHHDATVTFRGGILLACALTTVLIASMLPGRNPTTAVFGLRPLEWIGARSYGIYLWHWPILLILTEILGPSAYDSVTSWTIRGLTLVTTLVVAEASFRWLETPVRRLGFTGALRDFIAHARDGGRRAGGTAARVAVVVGALALAGSALALWLAPATSATQEQTEAGEQLVAASTRHDAGAGSEDDASSDDGVPGTSVLDTTVLDTTVPTGAEITGFGDSIMVTSAHGLTHRWPEIALDAESNRQWPDGLAAVRQRLADGDVRRAVVLDFGTNAGVRDPDVVRQTLEALGANRMVVVVNLYGGSYWIPDANAVLAEVVAEYPNAIIADWYTAIDERPELLQSDGIHPGIEGGHFYTDVVAEAFEELSARLSPPNG